ncbi:aminoglycoside phosphotransferase family protein [Nitrincola sp. MINF-07-Sa-05]|uniref:aminoglycoside phosphotransferase family protein n=1 Tax=Nitrincola salilacus TaxID=3400273 RepID=UPI00391861A3
MKIGYLDRVWSDGLAGWCPESWVLVSINGKPCCTLHCQDQRLDVQAAGHSEDGLVGFQAPVQFASGDIVRVTTLQGIPLHNSPWLYLAPQSQNWLPAALADTHPEYAAIAALKSELNFDHFRPLLGQVGQVVATVLATHDQPERVVRLNTDYREAADLTRFHLLVLTPAAISCPALHKTLNIDGRLVQIFDYCTGVTLDQYGPGWECWIPRVIEELKRLQDAGEEQRKTLGRRSHKGTLLRKQLLGGLSDGLRSPRAPGERRFLLWLLTTLWRLPRVLSHGDLHRNNVLVDAKRDTIALIDWDRWGYLPVGFDLARLLRGVPGERVEMLVGGDWQQRLGVLGFTYLLQRLDRPGFASSAEGEELRQRCLTLARHAGNQETSK